MRPPAPPPVQAQIPPLPQASNDLTMNVLELENPIKRIEKEKRSKLDSKSTKYVFIGYGGDEYGYKLWDF